MAAKGSSTGTDSRTPHRGMNGGINRAFLLVVVLAATASAGEMQGHDGIRWEKAQLPESVFAIVGDETITLEQYQVNLHASIKQRFFHGNIPQDKLDALRGEVAGQLIDRVLLRREAKRRGLAPDSAWVKQREDEISQRYRASPQWEKNKQDLLATLRAQLEEDSLIDHLESLVKEQVPAPSDEEVHRYYKTHQDRFTTPERMRVSIILLKVEPWSPDTAWQAAIDEARRLIAQLRDGGGHDFAELARFHSSDESAEAGGDLGYVHKGMLTDEAQQVLDKMHVGDISEPVQLLRGIAIFRLDERDEPVLNSFEDSAKRAQGLLIRERKEQVWGEFLEALRANTRIRVNESML